MNQRTDISFVLDWKKVSIDFARDAHLSPNSTLLQFLRSLPNHKGTKEGCAEGDCGACTVIIAESGSDDIFSYKAVTACLVLLPMIHGKQILSIENLSTDKQLHPLQTSYIEHHASQCGFCTPGFIMTSLELYKSNRKLNDSIVKKHLAGNLCRCTGYQPIIKATNEACLKAKPDLISKGELKALQLLKGINNDSFIISYLDFSYYKPSNLKDLLKIKSSNSSALLINGATDVALRITKKHEVLSEIIDISGIHDLRNIELNMEFVAIGAGVDLNTLENGLPDDFEALKNILNQFASQQIRNLATIGGNIASASPIGDLLPILSIYKASVVLVSLSGKRELLIQEFITGYRKTDLRNDEIIVQINIPFPDKSMVFSMFKISKRQDLDISSVSAAFRLKRSKDTVEEFEAVYGGMSDSIIRPDSTITYLTGKIWKDNTIQNALKILQTDFSPISDARSSAEGRMQMAGNLLRKFYLENQ